MQADLLARLNSPNLRQRFSAIAEVNALGAAGAFALPQLALALQDDGYLCEQTHDDYSLICERAAQTLQNMGAPAVPVLLNALANTTVHSCPVKCYDQGAYIGDYASREVAVCELARAALRRMLRANPRLVELIAELGKTASNDDVNRWVKMLSK